jgi:hypothetical protein
MSDGDWIKYDVYLHSKPSPAWTFYEGKVTVMAEGIEEAKERAVGQLARGSFKDRGRDAWVIERVVSR